MLLPRRMGHRADNQGRVTYDFDFIGKDTTYGSVSANPTVAADHDRLTVHSTTDNVEVFATQKPTPEYDSAESALTFSAQTNKRPRVIG